MSTIFILLLALGVIFWRPPFRIPQYFKRVFRPAIFMILILILLVISGVKSLSNPAKENCKQTKLNPDKTVKQLIIH